MIEDISSATDTSTIEVKIVPNIPASKHLKFLIRLPLKALQELQPPTAAKTAT